MITAVVLTKNAVKTLGKCLDSLKWCDEIIVIDDYSEDKTVTIAKSRGAKVYYRRLRNNFAAQRNFALRKATNKWVLFVDADEEVTSSLHHEIVRRLGKGSEVGFYIPRREFFCGKVLKGADKPANDWSWGPLKLLRLAQKTAGKWKGKVHEQWVVKGKTGQFSSFLLHYSFPDIKTALEKINFYSSLAAKGCVQKKRVFWWEIIIYPIGKFLKNFFWHGGIRDGTRGLIWALLMSIHSFLNKAKIWEQQQKGEPRSCQ